MLLNTFCHIPRISLWKEAQLWNEGIHSWEDAKEMEVTKLKKETWMTYLEESELAVEHNDVFYFADKLQDTLHWRLFPHFRNRMAYLDIETTGLLDGWSDITTIALYDGQEIKTYVDGQNLHKFIEDVAQYDILVSFNGKSFDLPFLKKAFQVDFPQAHIDMMYLLRQVGYTGGLKSIEKQMGIDRYELDGVFGYTAVLLWAEYVNYKDERALETLLSYNVADVLSLEALLIKAYNLKLRETPFAKQLKLPDPVVAQNPYHSHSEILDKIYQRFDSVHVRNVITRNAR